MRIRRKADFSHMRKGKRIQLDSIRCVFLANKLNHARLGLAVSRKYGTAVQRNRFKRQVRDCFRKHAIRDKGVDLLIVPLACAINIGNPSAISQHLFTELMHKLERP